jgi:hypothetical protein
MMKRTCIILTVSALALWTVETTQGAAPTTGTTTGGTTKGGTTTGGTTTGGTTTGGTTTGGTTTGGSNTNSTTGGRIRVGYTRQYSSFSRSYTRASNRGIARGSTTNTLRSARLKLRLGGRTYSSVRLNLRLGYGTTGGTTTGGTGTTTGGTGTTTGGSS